MKNHYSLLFAAVIFLTTHAAYAQSCDDFFPQKEGTVLKYVNYDKKDKVTGSSEMSFKDKNSTAESTSVVFMSRFSDEKGEEVYENQMKVECKNGILYFDASKFLDPAAMSAYESMEVEVEADRLEMPLNASAGMELADGMVTAVVRSSGVKIVTITVNISDRKIAARETMETPAGKFACIKYTYSALSQIGFVKVNMTAVEWYSPEYGTIRSESYNKSGKLMSYTVLESLQ